MEVILKEEVPKLGTIGDVVKVKPGYARNYLIPRGLAVVADSRNLAALEHQKRVAADQRERKRRKAEALARQLAETRVTIRARAGEEGKLFGSVTNQDIERALQEQGIGVDRRRIVLDEPIKTLGEYQVLVRLPLGVDAQVSVAVVAQES